MNCNRCGYRIENGMNQCPNCGNIVNNQMYNGYNNQMNNGYNNQMNNGYGPKPTCGTATASMILGILSLFCFGIFTAIPAVILGYSARKKIAAEGLGGSGQATAGIVIGWIEIILWVLLVVLLIVTPLIATMAE